MRDDFKPVQRFRLRHLIDDDLVVAQRLLRNAMPRLDHGRLRRARGRAHAGGAREEATDRHRVGGVIGTLVDHLQHVAAAQHRCGDLDAAGAPAIGQRHLARAERDLMPRDRHRLQQRAADHPLRLLVQVGEVVALHRYILPLPLREGVGGRGPRDTATPPPPNPLPQGEGESFAFPFAFAFAFPFLACTRHRSHSAASALSAVRATSRCSRRTFCSSLWKST